jgi:hypothetical protein
LDKRDGEAWEADRKHRGDVAIAGGGRAGWEERQRRARRKVKKDEK